MNEVSNQISGTKTIRRGDRLQCSADIIPISEFYVNLFKTEYGRTQVCLASIPKSVTIAHDEFFLCDCKIVGICNLHVVHVSLGHFSYAFYFHF